MTTQVNTNIQIDHALYDAWNANNIGRIKATFSIDFQAEEPGESPLNGAQYAAYVQNIFAAFPGCTMETLLDICQDDYVVTHWKFSGVHTGPLQTSPGTSIPATGKPVTLYGSTTHLIRNGKLAHMVSFWDRTSLLNQLGIRLTR
jgi:predicted ester cyclase